MRTVRAHLATLLVLLLLLPASFSPAHAQDAKLPHEQLLKAQLIEIPMGSVVEVKLRKQPKVRGKLGNLRDTDFELQSLKSGKIVTESISLADVKSVKMQGKGMGLPLKIVTGTLIGLGVIMVVGVVVAATGGWRD